MKIQIDLKSALCGLLAGGAVIFCIGAATSPNPAGRYQVAAALNHFVLIDTQTGQAWGADAQINFQDTGAFWGPK